MLTADLVRARKKAGELQVSALKGKTRARALELSEAYLAVAESHIGECRDDLKTAWNNVDLGGRDKRLADGILKLIDDACEFESEADLEPLALRSDVFLEASAQREALSAGESFDRERVLSKVAATQKLQTEVIERGLYSDLRGAQVLQSFQSVSPEALVERYETAQVQAVLLKAVSVRAEVYCANARGYRALFRALKFRRLLYTISPLQGDEGKSGYLIEISGPYSLFGSSTKYGL